MATTAGRDVHLDDAAQVATVRRAIMACSIGQVFEIFDFVIYAYFASAIGKAFFPSGDPATELLSSLLTYGVGFLARPLGALVIGYFGEGKTTDLLIWSQVILSMQLSFAVIPLLLFTNDKVKMGPFANPLWIKILASLSAAIIVVLNFKLLFDFFTPESWQQALGF